MCTTDKYNQDCLSLDKVLFINVVLGFSKITSVFWGRYNQQYPVLG